MEVDAKVRPWPGAEDSYIEITVVPGDRTLKVRAWFKSYFSSVSYDRFPHSFHDSDTKICAYNNNDEGWDEFPATRMLEALLADGFSVEGTDNRGRSYEREKVPAVAWMAIESHCQIVYFNKGFGPGHPAHDYAIQWLKEHGFYGNSTYMSWRDKGQLVMALIIESMKEGVKRYVGDEFIAAMISAGYGMEGTFRDGSVIPTEYRMSRTKNWFDALKDLVGTGCIPECAHRILLYGPPGTGKSSFTGLVFKGDVERVSLHPAMPIEDLIGSVGLKSSDSGGTDTTWQDGPAVRAMRKGIPLVLDEIDQYSPELRCCLHAILDDLSIAGITLPTGERVLPEEGFVVFATTNAVPSALPAALLDRFDLTMLCDRPAQGVFKEISIKGMDKYLQRTYDRTATARWIPAVTVRTVLALERMSKKLGAEKAAELVYGNKGADILASAATGK